MLFAPTVPDAGTMTEDLVAEMAGPLLDTAQNMLVYLVPALLGFWALAFVWARLGAPLADKRAFAADVAREQQRRKRAEYRKRVRDAAREDAVGGAYHNSHK